MPLPLQGGLPDPGPPSRDLPVTVTRLGRGRPAQNKNAIRTRIRNELIQLISEGLEISHDLIAKRTEVSRRTVCRYFPDRRSLPESAWDCVAELGWHHVVLPRSEEDLTETLYEIYMGLDRIAPIVTVIQSTPLGRAIPRASNERRVQSYTAAMADAVKRLPRPDREIAPALVQALHATPWLEMRDHWGLTGAQMARATHWAICTLLDAAPRARARNPSR